MRRTNYDDDFSLQTLMNSFQRLTPEQAQLVLEAIICWMTNRPLDKKVEFTTPMVYVLSVVLSWYKPAWWHWDL